VSDSVLYAAVGAGLTYANLRNEVSADAASGKKISRRTYWVAYRKCRGKKSAIAKELLVSDEALRQWERSNLVNLRSPK
jgi:hypothetical protein